jgi:methionyl-tRNA formyltransferase
VFDTVILLTGPVEQPVLASVLRSHDPHLTIMPAVTAADLDAFAPDLLRRSRLVAFTTSVIVPPRVLDALGYGAYNFHPGSPEYPGWAPAHFAIYDRAPLFGATAHVMIERVDSGPIVGVEWLPVPTDATVHSLECLAYAALARLYWVLAKDLATQAQPLVDLGIEWGNRRGSRRAYAAMCDIPPDISREELDRRVRAFGSDHFGMNPTIALHGHTFRLGKSDDDRPAMERKGEAARAMPLPGHRDDTVLDAVA